MSHPIHLILSSGTRIVARSDADRDALLRVRDQGGAAAHALPPQDLRARGDCNARSASLVWATDSQGLGSQIKWKHAMHLMRLLLSVISALRAPGRRA